MKPDVDQPSVAIALIAAAFVTQAWATAAIARAGTPEILWASSDISVLLDDVVARPGDIVVDLVGANAVTTLPGLPATANLTGLSAELNGDTLFTLDTTAEIGGITVTPRDVVRFDGSTYQIELAGEAAGLPPLAAIDGLSSAPGFLMFSFDTTVQLAGLIVDDEDLVLLDRGGNSWSLAFDGSVRGIDPGLDLDAVHWTPASHLLLSFDGSGTVGGLVFHDEDVLRFHLPNGPWELAVSARDVSPAWGTADLDALALQPGGGSALIFADGFESGDTSAW